MTNLHPIAPPPELADTLRTEMRAGYDKGVTDSEPWDNAIAKAYQAGADMELELTLKLMRTLQIRGVDYIYHARRPNLRGKTLSLKERLTMAIVNGDGPLAIQLLNEALPND